MRMTQKPRMQYKEILKLLEKLLPVYQKRLKCSIQKLNGGY